MFKGKVRLKEALLILMRSCDFIFLQIYGNKTHFGDYITCLRFVRTVVSKRRYTMLSTIYLQYHFILKVLLNT